MSSFTLADLPDLRGRTALVTGANSGLGLETARALARAGATVLMAARDRTKHDRAEADLRRTDPDADVRYVELDLADLASVEHAAREVAGEVEALDVLVNNAGVMMTPQATTADGFELQLGTNHFGHFALTMRLLDRLLAAEDPRVVTVSSFMHHQGEIDRDDLHLRRPGAYTPTRAYSQSKLANLLFALELQRRFEAAGHRARSLAAHPGYAATKLQSSGVRLGGRTLFHRAADVAMAVTNRLVAQSAADGALPQVYAAVGDEPGGTYWGPTGFRELRGGVGQAHVGRRARDPELAAWLWEASVEATGVGSTLSEPGL